GSRWLHVLLDETLERQQKLWNPPRRWYRGSEAGDTCVRSMTLSVMGHSVPVPAKTKRIFRTGNAVEDANMQTMREAGIVIESKQKDKQHEIRYKDPPIVGHIDVMARKPTEDNKRLCGEIKSINSFGFKALPSEHDDPRVNMRNLMAKKPGYICQWNIYSGAPNLDLPEGFMLFEEKNVQSQLIYMLERDDDLLVEILERMRKGTKYILADPMLVAPIPKDRNPRGADEQCQRCSRKYLCMRLPDEGTTYDEVRRVDAEVRS
ncbi:hypothetical protein LCGC14_3045350, partial [marine sediment metagenome]